MTHTPKIPNMAIPLILEWIVCPTDRSNYTEAQINSVADAIYNDGCINKLLEVTRIQKEKYLLVNEKDFLLYFAAKHIHEQGWFKDVDFTIMVLVTEKKLTQMDLLYELNTVTATGVIEVGLLDLIAPDMLETVLKGCKVRKTSIGLIKELALNGARLTLTNIIKVKGVGKVTLKNIENFLLASANTQGSRFNNYR